MDDIQTVIQDLHTLIAHDQNPQHKVVYSQCLNALLKIQAELHSASTQAQQADPRVALMSALGGGGGGQPPMMAGR